MHRLRDALRSINPGVPDAAIETAIERLTENRSAMDRVRANREVYRLLRDGMKVEAEVNGKRETVTVRYVHWDHAEANDWLAVSQLWVTGEMYKRRADLVLFVNGIPLVFIELKASHKNVRHAYDDNLRDYRDTIPHLLVQRLRHPLQRLATPRSAPPTPPWEHFAEWKKINYEGEDGVVTLETALRGTCDRYRLLDLVENFIVFTERPGGLIKVVAKNHQYLGVNNAIEAAAHGPGREELAARRLLAHPGQRQVALDAVLHPEGLRKLPGNWTFVVVTDRRSSTTRSTRTSPPPASLTDRRERPRRDRRAPARAPRRGPPLRLHADPEVPHARDGRRPMPVLSERADIIVITDEAHRTQYDKLAWNMRQRPAQRRVPRLHRHAADRRRGAATREVFGDYVSRLQLPRLDRGRRHRPALLREPHPRAAAHQRGLRRRARSTARRGRPRRGAGEEASRASSPASTTSSPATTGWTRSPTTSSRHFIGRGFRGKAMVVSIDKATAVRMYDHVQKHWAAHLAELEAQLATDAEAGARRRWRRPIEFMRTDRHGRGRLAVPERGRRHGRAGLDIAPHRKRMVNEDLDAKFKDPDDPFRLVFVCAMWITGFDAPSCSTIYLDKPMRNHTLMQTIARANRVFPDKDNGLIVDYVGVFRNLEAALAIYGAAREGEGDTPHPAQGRAGRRPRRSARGDRRLPGSQRRRPRRSRGGEGLRVHRPPEVRGRGPAGRRHHAPAVREPRPPGADRLQGPAARPGGPGQ